MTSPRRWAWLAMLACACTPTSPPTAAAAPRSPCGLRTDDWCPAPPGDPCGAHRDAPACMADERCEAIPYRGESLEGCLRDARCFARNCPAVGCVSRCESLSPERCARDGARCVVRGGACVRATPCAHGPARPRG